MAKTKQKKKLTDREFEIYTNGLKAWGADLIEKIKGLPVWVYDFGQDEKLDMVKKGDVLALLNKECKCKKCGKNMRGLTTSYWDLCNDCGKDEVEK